MSEHIRRSVGLYAAHAISAATRPGAVQRPSVHVTEEIQKNGARHFVSWRL